MVRERRSVRVQRGALVLVLAGLAVGFILLSRAGRTPHDEQASVPRTTEVPPPSNSRGPAIVFTEQPTEATGFETTELWVRSASDNRPLPEAQVLLRRYQPPGSDRAFTLEEMRTGFGPEGDHPEGTFALAGQEGLFAVPPGRLFLTVTAPGHLSWQDSLELVQPHTLLLDPSGRILVTCRAGASLEPGVAILVRPAGEDLSFAVQVSSDPHGRAVIEVPPGEYRLSYRGERSVKGWQPGTDHERFEWAGGQMIQDRESQFPVTLSGEISVSAGETAEALLELWSDSGIAGVVAFPRVLPGYTRQAASLYVAGQRIRIGPDGHPMVAGSFAEKGQRPLADDGAFSITGLTPGPKRVHAQCTDWPPAGSDRPILFWLVSEELELPEGRIVDLGVLRPAPGSVSGEIIFQGAAGRYPATEVTSLTDPTCTFFIREDREGETANDHFSRVSAEFTVPMDTRFEVHGCPYARASGASTVIKIELSRLDERLVSSLHAGFVLGRQRSIIRVRPGEHFQFPIDMSFSEPREDNVRFLPLFPPGSEPVPVRFSLMRDGATKTLTITSPAAALDPGAYHVFASAQAPGLRWFAMASLEVPEQGSVELPIDLQEGVNVEVRVGAQGPDWLRLQPVAVGGRPWPLGAPGDLFLAVVQDGVARFTGVPRGTAFELLPALRSQLDRFPRSRAHHATTDVTLGYP